MKNNKLVIILLTILIILISIIIVLLVSIKDKETFKIPDFDKEISVIPDSLNYEKSVLNILNGYSVYISPNPKMVDDNYLKIDFVSVKTNSVYVKVRIFDKMGNVIGETGLLKPGDYLEKVKLNKNLEVNDGLTYKIMGYDKDTYISAGSVNLSTKVGE